uniref:Uncharacterized protein n=1 Tax=Hucho hucho TaxID=62062 RepID=A0A4W5PXA1_9TELE
MVTPSQQEEVGVALEEFQGVILSTDTQNGDGDFVYVPEGFIAFPVGIPGSPTGSFRARRLAEQHLLQATQGTAGEKGVGVHCLTQHCPSPVERPDGSVLKPGLAAEHWREAGGGRHVAG